jgi:hypothetical protein
MQKVSNITELNEVISISCFVVLFDDDKTCLRELLLSDPRVDKQRIEQTKGGLLYDSFSWILENNEFQGWRQSNCSRLLWIKGDAGKGKTMLLIGIINELQKEVQSVTCLEKECISYFLCQATDPRLNNATVILRGLIYLLIIQRPSLILYLRDKYEHAGRKLFDDQTALYSLCEIFKEMLNDPGLTSVYLAVDALDECDEGLPQFLDLITQTIADNPHHVKWVISSRNRHDIEQRLTLDRSHTRVSLELYANHISQAINVYIDYKISQLIVLRQNKVLRENVREKLRQKSDCTFLWVALVVEELQDIIGADILEVLEEVPSGLTPFYDRIMEQIKKLPQRNLKRCLLVLSRASLAYRPLRLHEMHIIAGFGEEFTHLEDLQRIVHMCGSFLTIRDNHVHFIHQSAKDYLTMNASAAIFPSGTGKIHHEIFMQSLNALSKTLRQNIYTLSGPGPVTGNIIPNPDPLVPISYSCLFLFNHLCEADNSEYTQDLSDHGKTFAFLKQHLLQWLEALGLLRKVPDGLLIIRMLLQKRQVC